MNERRTDREFEAEYARGGPRNRAELLDISDPSLGQNCSHCCPKHCPQHCPPDSDAGSGGLAGPLGPPLSIREVATLIGCSVWTLRQRYLPAGLPHVRSGPNAKFIFYRNQIIRWLLCRQEKGGINA